MTESTSPYGATQTPARVRFAPSPTGMLHIGGVRTAIFDWLLARQTCGQFILRIEDTDQRRFVEGAAEDIMESLRWYGLDWDEGPGVGGPDEPYFQSERRCYYSTAVEKLISAGAAYVCDCPPERLAEVRKQQQAAGQPPGYDGRCRNRQLEYIADPDGQGTDTVVRMLVPDQGELTFHDVVRQEVTFDLANLTDFVIMKSDGMPTYHLAHVVDDHEMKISHVLRGEEWISSTPRHMLIHQGLGITPPVYVHLPLLLGKDRSKLSKRHGADRALAYREQGFLPDAMFNFLALLGWSPGDDTEVMARDEIVQRFSLDQVSESPAVFDVEKMTWMNGVYIRNTDGGELASMLTPVLSDPADGLPESVPRPLEQGRVAALTPLIHERLKRLDEAPGLLDFFFMDDVSPDPDELIQRRMDRDSTIAALDAALDLCRAVESFEPEPLESAYRALTKEIGLKAGQLFGTIRVAVTGRRVAPPLFDTMAAIGREKCASRIENARHLLSQKADS